MDDHLLELRNIGKTFSGVNVLRGIDLVLKKGEVHALLGENGAGKSTLIKILNGYYQPDKGGEIKIEGRVVQFKKPKDALDASIHTIYQELTLCPLMTVAEILSGYSSEIRYVPVPLHCNRDTLKTLHLPPNMH